jgi:myo-inositol catabolism protein IolC
VPNSRPLFFLAFDHRVVLTKIFAAAGIESPLVTIAHAKSLVFEGLDAASKIEPRIAGSSGFLVDEQYGSHTAILAKRHGHQLAMPVEMSEQFPMKREFGDDFATHIEAFDPTYVKVLVRYNPADDDTVNKAQAENLSDLGAWCRDAGREYMVEVLVPPTDQQLAAANGDGARYQREQLPALISRAVESLRDRGVAPEIWKLEGLDTAEDAGRVAASCTEGAGGNVRCIVLGRGEGADQVDTWVRAAAASGAYDGFAIGRTIWKDAVLGYFGGTLSRVEAIEDITKRYLRYVGPFLEARPVEATSSTATA